MQVMQVMSSELEVVGPKATVQEVAEKMRRRDVGIVPVVEKELVIGVITDRDIALRLVADARSAKRTRAYEVMTQSVAHCFADQSVDEAATLMKTRGVRRLVVLNRDQYPVGIVSVTDVALQLDSRLSGDILKHVARG